MPASFPKEFWGKGMMQVRTVAAVANGALVLMLYVAGWGVPSWTIAMTEVGLAGTAALCSWYALKRLKAPRWTVRFVYRRREDAHA